MIKAILTGCLLITSAFFFFISIKGFIGLKKSLKDREHDDEDLMKFAVIIGCWFVAILFLAIAHLASNG